MGEEARYVLFVGQEDYYLTGNIFVVSGADDAVKKLKTLMFVESFNEKFFMENHKTGVWKLDGDYIVAEMMTPAEYQSKIRSEYEARERKMLSLVREYDEAKTADSEVNK